MDSPVRKYLIYNCAYVLLKLSFVIALVVNLLMCPSQHNFYFFKVCVSESEVVP